MRTFADVDLAVIAGLMPDSAGLHTNDPLHPIVAEMAALHVSVPFQSAMIPRTDAAGMLSGPAASCSFTILCMAAMHAHMDAAPHGSRALHVCAPGLPCFAMHSGLEVRVQSFRLPHTEAAGPCWNALRPSRKCLNGSYRRA